MPLMTYFSLFKIIKYFLLINFILLLSCSPKENKKNIDDKELSTQYYSIKNVKSLCELNNIDQNFNTIFTEDLENFICIDNSKNTIHKINIKSENTIVKGGIGKGPAEFSVILYSDFKYNNLYIVDYDLRRLSIFNDNLDYNGSFLIKNNFVTDIEIIDNDIYTIGRNLNEFNYNEYYLASVYRRKEESNYYTFNGYSVRLSRDIEKKLKSKKLYSYASIQTHNVNENIYFAHSYLPYILKYNINTEDISYLDLDFPQYIDPLKINYKNLKKMPEIKKNQLDHLTEFHYTYYPVFINYDKYLKIFIIQYGVPFQFIFKSQIQYFYATVIFDEYFKFKSIFYTNFKIISCSNIDDKYYYIEKFDSGLYELFEFGNESIIPDENEQIRITKIEEK